MSSNTLSGRRQGMPRSFVRHFPDGSRRETVTVDELVVRSVCRRARLP
jgi:hypothetical protein